MTYRRGLLIIFLWLAFFLRVWGLDFGLPYDFHPDEHFYVEPVLTWHIEGEAGSGLDPSLFTRLPFKYTLLVGYWLWFVMSPFVQTEQWITATWFFARFWSVIFGVLTVALAYPAGKRLYGVRGGLLATVIMAGLFLPIRESHFVVNDAAVTFFVLLAIYLSVLLFWRRRWFDFLFAGIVIGLAAATKLTGWFAFIALFTAYILTFVNWGEPLSTKSLKETDRKKELKYIGLSFLAVVVILVLSSVRSLGALPEFFLRLVNLFRSASSFYTNSFNGIQMAPFSGWQFYINVLGWGIGWLLVVIIIWAIGSVCWRRYRPGIVLVVFSLVFFWYIGGREFLFARFILPIVPPLVILAAGELSRLKIDRFVGQRYQAVFWPALVTLLLLQPLSTSIWFDYLLTLPDTRQEATDWVVKEFLPDTVIVNERYSVFPSVPFLDNQWPLLFKVAPLNAYGATRNSVDHYLSNKTDLIIVSSFTSDRARQDVDEEAARIAQQSMLNQKAELIKTFSPYRDQEYSNSWFYLDELYSPAGETLLRKQPGPLIKIYRLPYQNQPYSLETPPISVPIEANFDNKMMLLGYDIPVRRGNPGEAIPVTLYWQALSAMDENYVIFNHLLDSQQRNWGGYDRWPQETSKTTLWRPDEIVVDTFSIPIAEDAPDGVYSIDIGLYAQDDPQGRSLTLLNDGVPIDQNSVGLGVVKIGGPPPDVAAGKTVPDHPVGTDLGGIIRLNGFDEPSIKPEQIQLQLYWESLAETNVDYTVFVHVRDLASNVVAQMDRPPANGNYPTLLWGAGEVISDAVTIPLPETLPTGQYTLAVGLYDFTSGVRLPVENSPDNSVTLTTLTLE